MSDEMMQTSRAIPINIRMILIILILIAALGIPTYLSTTQQTKLAEDVQEGLRLQERDLNISASLEQVIGTINELAKESQFSAYLKSHREELENETDLFKIRQDIIITVAEINNLLFDRQAEKYNLVNVNLTFEGFQNAEMIKELSQAKRIIETNMTTNLEDLASKTDEYISKINQAAIDLAYIVGQPTSSANISVSLTGNATATLNSLKSHLKSKLSAAKSSKDNETIIYVVDTLYELENLNNLIDDINSLVQKYLTVALTESPESLLDYSKKFKQSFELISSQADFLLDKFLDPTAIGYYALQADDLVYIQNLDPMIRGNTTQKGMIQYLNSSLNLVFETESLIDQITDIQSTSLKSAVNNIIIFLETIKRVVLFELDSFTFTFNTYVKFRSAANNIILSITLAILGILVFGGTIPFLNRVRKITVRLDDGFQKIVNYDLSIKKFDKIEGGELGRIQYGFNKMVDELQLILQSLADASETLSSISETMASGSQEASASVTEVSDTIAQISYGASEQNRLIQQLSDLLKKHMDEVNEASVKISEASTFVQQVAKRTNILGLNASIEAAKAGHFGRGFNVVAENVRELSEDTKRSANEIASLIETISQNISNTVKTVIEEMEEARMISENTASGTEEANAATTEQVSMLSEISEQAAEIANIATELNSIMARFKFAK